MRQLVESVENHLYLTFELFHYYKKVLQSIKQLNVLTKFLVLTSKMLVVPFGSMCFVVVELPTYDWFPFIFKVFLLTASFLFGIPGYLLIAKLAQVDKLSKKLHVKLHSIIARREHHCRKSVSLLTINSCQIFEVR